MNNVAFSGKTALITGAGQGIGFAIAGALARAGCNILLNDFDATLAEQAAETLRSETGRNATLACPGDAGDVAFIQTMVETAVAQFGRLDYVVANAGMTFFGDFFATTPTDFQNVVNLNLRGSFFLTQIAARQLREQSGGSILLMSSVVGQLAHPDLAAYAMTKAALAHLAKTLVPDLSPLGITINALAPGATLTERTLDDADYVPIWSKITPMGRPATVQDITDAALFLLSAPHITGQTLTVDGGWTSVGVPPV